MKTTRLAASVIAEDASLALKDSIGSVQVTPTNRSTLKQIFFGWPNLEVVTQKLAGLIGSHHPGESGQALLPKCLAIAARSYETAHDTARQEASPASAYLEALIKTASEIVHYDTYGLSGKHSKLWKPSETSLTEFARDFDEIQFVRVESTEEVRQGAQLILASRIMLIEDASLIASAKQVEYKAKDNIFHMPVFCS